MMYGPPLLLEERYSQACLGYYPDHTDGLLHNVECSTDPRNINISRRIRSHRLAVSSAHTMASFLCTAVSFACS